VLNVYVKSYAINTLVTHFLMVQANEKKTIGLARYERAS